MTHDPPMGTVPASISRITQEQIQNGEDRLAVEVPVALVFNGITHAVMMVTPCDLEDFALGFGVTEGLLSTPSDLYGSEVVPTPDGLELRLEVSAACAWRLKEHRRSLAGRTGCGLCGADSLQQVRRDLPAVAAVQVATTVILNAEQNLRQHQTLQRLTGATHAAAWVDLNGDIHAVYEDVGRHNALDKLIGGLLWRNTDPSSGFVLITSRASFEMVQKTLVFGAGVLAAVSAATAMAVETARRGNLALAGYVRHDTQTLVAYSHPDRFIPPP